MKCGYGALVRFLRLKSEVLSAAYLKTYKSAVLHVLSVAGKPMSYVESSDLDAMLQGLEASEPPRPMRGAITEPMVEEIAREGYRRGLPEVSKGIIVAHGIACRPRDIAELTGNRVNLQSGTVRVRAKRARYLRRKMGEWETHPIVTDGAYGILSTKCRMSTLGPLFPAWDEAQARDLIQGVAKKRGWDPELIWDGPHALRHGAAADAMSKALGEVRKVGAWATDSSARHYGRQNEDRKRQRE